MAYNPNIPIVTDYMSISNIQCRSNFQAINSVWAKNHVSLTSKENLGMHTFMILRPQIGITPDPATTVSQVALYTKLISNVPQLFLSPSNNQTPIQLTSSNILTGLQSTNPDVYYARQYSFLPGPFTMYFGRISVVDGQVITLTPSTTLLYVSVMQVAGGPGTGAAATNIAANQFTVRLPQTTSPGPFAISYLAVGI